MASRQRRFGRLTNSIVLCGTVCVSGRQTTQTDAFDETRHVVTQTDRKAGCYGDALKTIPALPRGIVGSGRETVGYSHAA